MKALIAAALILTAAVTLLTCSLARDMSGMIAEHQAARMQHTEAGTRTGRVRDDGTDVVDYTDAMVTVYGAPDVNVLWLAINSRVR